jgi:hypothetical protein
MVMFVEVSVKDNIVYFVNGTILEVMLDDLI